MLLGDWCHDWMQDFRLWWKPWVNVQHASQAWYLNPHTASDSEASPRRPCDRIPITYLGTKPTSMKTTYLASTLKILCADLDYLNYNILSQPSRAWIGRGLRSQCGNNAATSVNTNRPPFRTSRDYPNTAQSHSRRILGIFSARTSLYTVK